MKNIVTFLVIMTFISCSESKDKIEILQKENQELKTQIEIFKKEISKYDFTPTVIPKSDRVELGDDFQSLIGVVVSKKASPLNIEFGDFIDGEFHKSTDTVFDTLENYVLYRKHTSNLGLEKFGGKVEFTFFDSTFVTYFQGQYDVILKKK